MTDKTDPDMDDIDAFLRGETPLSIPAADDDNRVLPQPLSSLPKTTDPVIRLNSRVTHIHRNLSNALTFADDYKQELTADQSLSDELDNDLQQWIVVMHDLEQALPDLPELAMQETEEDLLHDGVTEAIAAHIDTYVEAARESDKTNSAAFTELRAGQQATTGTDASSPKLADRPAHKQAEAVNDAPTVNREQLELIKSLEERESRIRELEGRLQSLELPASEDNEVTEDTASQEANGLYVNRIIVAVNGNANLKYPLSRHIMTIGREPHNDIHIRSRYVSRFHARIVSDRDGSVIEDLDSRNGVAVNSRKVRRRQLKSGDLIDLGRIQLKYIDLMEGDADEGRA